MVVLSCRFYKEKYPEVNTRSHCTPVIAVNSHNFLLSPFFFSVSVRGRWCTQVEDVVMVNVRAIAEMGAYVYLLEYNSIEGMILLSELSRRRIRSINKLIRVGKTEPVVVIRVDKEKGYIDLSKRRVSAEDVEKCTERFAKAKAVNSILRHVADILKFETNEQLEELYQKTAWHFEEKYKSKAAAYDVFKQAVIDPSILDECGLEESTKEVLLNNIRRKLTSQAVKIRADIECACYEYEGIDAVKEALRAGLELSTEELPIKINLIAPPLYGKCCPHRHAMQSMQWLFSFFFFLSRRNSNDYVDAGEGRWFESIGECHRKDSGNH